MNSIPLLTALLLFVATTARASAANHDIASNNGKQAMPLKIADTLGDQANAMALQASIGGELRSRVGDACHLVLHNADNMTAVIRDPLKVGLGIDMVPHASMRAALPAFAVILANLTDSANTTEDTFQVIAVHLKSLEVAPGGQLTYKMEIIDSDIARGTGPTTALPADIAASEVIGANTGESENAALPKRMVPESFQQATVIIDLVDFNDAASRPISIRHMAESGELAHNINKFIATANSPDDQVNAQGVATIGWMLPWSLWAWICCPTFFILTPWAVPLWVFCCI